MRDLVLSDGVVTLAAFRLADAPVLVAIDLDPEAARWFDFPSTTFDEPAHRAHAEGVIRNWSAEADAGTFYPFVIRRGEVAIGMVGLRPVDGNLGTLSYAVLPAERGHGIATRAVRLLARGAFTNTRLTRLEIRTDVDNVASQRVAERAGFVRDRVAPTGQFRNYAPFAGAPRDEIYFVLSTG